MRIRPGRLSDMQRLYDIDQACFPPGVSYSKRELAGFISRRGAKTWVVEDGEEIVAFLVLGRETREVGHVVTIDVVASSRRQGVGRALMDVAERWACDEGLKMLYLETAEDNLVAQRFYEARGYIKFDKIEHYYADSTAAWVMAKRLKVEQ